MTQNQTDLLERLRKRLHSAIADRLNYPKAAIGVARGRLLTPEETQKAASLLDACLCIVDAEMALLASEFEKGDQDVF